MNRIALLVSGLLAATPAVAGESHPMCGCVVRQIHGTMGAAVVFTGTLQQITHDAHGRTVFVFRAHERFWGPVEREMKLTAGTDDACPPTFAVGHSYLVYGYGPSHGQALYETGGCDPNLPTEKAGERIRDLTAFVIHAGQNPMEYHFRGG